MTGEIFEWQPIPEELQQVTNRSLAGLILKNSIRILWTRLPEQIREYVRRKTLLSISDEHALIRATGAMGAIQKICEDSADMLTPQEHLDVLIPKLLCFFSSPTAKL
ncbi:unnamed protein product, partial [Anisakis simplex]|uniref:Importin N-terminal domain-containing protein n=1 Tax=Anisakis simplex TaxID=6269 RepID=A0A0M3KF68_ANISI